MTKSRPLAMLFALSIAAASSLSSQEIVQSRGADPQLDYASLKAFGPWDDRNYQLTGSDVSLFADNEASLRPQVPAFYRVELRKRNPEMLRTGPVQYPHSALPQFFNLYGGYLIDGVYYRTADRTAAGFEVELDRPVQVDANRGGLIGEARVTNPIGAAESAIAFHPANPNLVIAGSNGPGGGNRMHWSNDGGITWTQVTLPLGATCCDPTVGWSSDGTLAYSATFPNNQSAIWFYRSSTNGQTWDDLASVDGDARREIGGGNVDKQFLHVDIAPTSPHQDNIYLTWHQGNVLRFSRSTDMGHTWSTPLVFTGDPRGIGSDISSDKNGNIFYTYLSFVTRQVLVKVSTDGGLTFSAATVVDTTNGAFIYPIPAQPNRGVPMIASMDVDASSSPFANSVYIAWPDASTGPTSNTPADNHSQVKVAYSRDQGATWTTSIPHEIGDVSTVDRYQSWVRVAPNGDVYIVFYDTRRTAARDAVDLFYNRSTDGAQTWGTPQRLTSVVSPEVSNSGFDFGDYNGIDIVLNDLIAIYTDNRDETGGSANSRDVYVAGIEILVSGIFANGFESGDTGAWSNTIP